MTMHPANVNLDDVKALVRHYKCEVTRWSDEEPAAIIMAIISRDYWVAVEQSLVD